MKHVMRYALLAFVGGFGVVFALGRQPTRESKKYPPVTALTEYGRDLGVGQEQDEFAFGYHAPK